MQGSRSTAQLEFGVLRGHPYVRDGALARPEPAVAVSTRMYTFPHDGSEGYGPIASRCTS